jgi:hypothetical protein
MLIPLFIPLKLYIAVTAIQRLCAVCTAILCGVPVLCVTARCHVMRCAGAVCDRTVSCYAVCRCCVWQHYAMCGVPGVVCYITMLCAVCPVLCVTALYHVRCARCCVLQHYAICGVPGVVYYKHYAMCGVPGAVCYSTLTCYAVCRCCVLQHADMCCVPVLCVNSMQTCYAVCPLQHALCLCSGRLSLYSVFCILCFGRP